VFKGELNSFTTNTISAINVDALIDNKLVVGNTENTSNKSIDNLINGMIESAEYITKEGAEIYKKKDKYKRYNHFNKELSSIPTQKKIDLVFEIEKRIKETDSRFSEIQVGYEENERIHEYQNTNGIKIKNKTNYYSIGLYIIVKTDKETKTHYETFIDNNFDKFNIEEFINHASREAIKKLNPTKLTSKKYNVVFAPEVTSTLLSFYVSQLSAEAILKNTSWFKDKINTQVANKKITIFETPLKKTIDFNNADDQGVATKNMNLIKKGVLLTYLHNLETARKFNVESNGHATLAGSKMNVGPHSALHLKPGRLSKEQLLIKADSGIYITELEGLHAGMNAQNGNFSLKCEGFVIENGKLTSPLDMMTINGNLFEIFKNIKAISEDIEYIKNDVKAPCLYLKKIAISF